MATTAKPKPIPDGYRRVTPALVVQGGAQALEYYTKVFDGTERLHFPGPDGTIAHAEIEVGDSVLMIEDESPAMGTNAPPPGDIDGPPTFLYVEDVDAHVEDVRPADMMARMAELQKEG